MAKPPGIIDRVNYVVKTVNNPCDTPWVVIAETAGKAALSVAIAVVCFDIFDVARFVFRPAGLRSGRHLSRGKKGQNKRSSKGLGRKLANKVPVLAALEQRTVSNGVKHMWIIDGIGQRLLWWWLMIDVSTAFFYNWTTMLAKTEKCQMANIPGAALGEGKPSGVLAIQGWQGVLVPEVPYVRGDMSMVLGQGQCGEGLWNITWGYTGQNETDTLAMASCGVKIVYPTNTDRVATDTQPIEPFMQASMVGTATIKGPFQYETEAKISFGAMAGVYAAISIMGDGTPPPPIKFTCPVPFFGNVG